MKRPYRFQITNPEKPKASNAPDEEQRKIGKQRQVVKAHRERKRLNSEIAEVWE